MGHEHANLLDRCFLLKARDTHVFLLTKLRNLLHTMISHGWAGILVLDFSQGFLADGWQRELVRRLVR